MFALYVISARRMSLSTHRSPAMVFFVKVSSAVSGPSLASIWCRCAIGQLRSIDSDMPISAAICANGWPMLSSKAISRGTICVAPIQYGCGYCHVICEMAAFPGKMLIIQAGWTRREGRAVTSRRAYVAKTGGKRAAMMLAGNREAIHRILPACPVAGRKLRHRFCKPLISRNIETPASSNFKPKAGLTIAPLVPTSINMSNHNQ